MLDFGFDGYEILGWFILDFGLLCWMWVGGWVEIDKLFFLGEIVDKVLII